MLKNPTLLIQNPPQRVTEAKRNFATHSDQAVEIKDPETHLKLRSKMSLTLLELLHPQSIKSFRKIRLRQVPVIASHTQKFKIYVIIESSQIVWTVKKGLEHLGRYVFIFAFWKVQKFWILIWKYNNSVLNGNVLHKNILNESVGSVLSVPKNSFCCQNIDFLAKKMKKWKMKDFRCHFGLIAVRITALQRFYRHLEGGNDSKVSRASCFFLLPPPKSFFLISSPHSHTYTLFCPLYFCDWDSQTWWRY